jgi:hypothetical protein
LKINQHLKNTNQDEQRNRHRRSRYRRTDD